MSTTNLLENRILSVIDSFAGKLPPGQLADMRSLVEAGERAVGLENLCTQIYEYDVKPAPDLIAEITDLGQAMRLNPKYWERLGAGPE